MSELIKPEFALVVIACIVIGFSLKSTPKIPNWSIVYILTVFAIIVCGSLTAFTAESVLQGILCAAVAVYGNQVVKQTVEGIGTK